MDANKLGLMFLSELSKRHDKEKQDALRMLAEQDGIPLDGSVSLNAGKWVLTADQPANLHLVEHPNV